MKKTVGGIPISHIDLGSGSGASQLLGQDPYHYELLNLAAGEAWHRSGLNRYCIYVMDGEDSALINRMEVSKDEFVLGESEQIDILAVNSPKRILVALQGVEVSAEPLRVCQLSKSKKVDKPWGHEIWLTGDPSPVFAFKKILLKAGNRTSLQYHHQKRETNFVVCGEADLQFCPNTELPAEQVTIEMIESIRLSGPFVADVFPGHVHRLVAHTDLTLMEVSTPELDDVVRIHDETGRSHGRISCEHG